MTPATVAIIVVAVIAIIVILVFISRSIWLVPPAPQARANVERLGRFHKTLEPGLNLGFPRIDRGKALIDLREQVVSFTGQRVITEDNVGVSIDTVLFFQVTDARAADYEIVNYIGAIEQLAATMLRSVIGSMDLEQTLTSRDKINTLLRGVLDDASGKWGIRVTRVEIRSIDPSQTIKDAMEKQLRAEREKRAAILHAEGMQQSQILTAEGDKRGAILRAEGEKQAAILRAEGEAQAISTVFKSIHHGDPDPKLLAYQYLQTLPQLARPGQHGLDDPERADRGAADAQLGLRAIGWPEGCRTRASRHTDSYAESFANRPASSAPVPQLSGPAGVDLAKDWPLCRRLPPGTRLLTCPDRATELVPPALTGGAFKFGSLGPGR